MSTNNAAQQGLGNRVQFLRPEAPAVLYILVKQRGIQARITKEHRQGKIHAAGLVDLLHQQVVAVPGAPGLADEGHDPILDRYHRLDIQNASGEGYGFGDAASLFQIFQGIQQGDHGYIRLFLLQLLRNFPGADPPVGAVYGVLGQHAGADGHGLAVHHIDVVVALRGNAGALIGAGELGGQTDNHGAVPIGRHLPKHLIKACRGGLAGGGELIGLNQTAIELLLVNGHSVIILLLPKAQGQGHHLDPVEIGFCHIRRGIYNNTNVHFVFLL